jgi:transcriptional regulator with XRE-family HTH domain
MEEDMDKTKAVMLFDDWFKSQGIRKNWFAQQLGVDNASISRWLSGKVKPHNAVRKRIEELTDGAVPMEAWK